MSCVVGAGAANHRVGVIVIGRNEGQRLLRCLASCAGIASRVYVDSGSTDGSAAAAAQLGASVVSLDMTLPFTAARARNAGLQQLLADDPSIELVQFVDGDCELMADWMPAALAFMEEHPDVVAVAGRRRERFPEATVFNQLCDIEWNTPIGEAKAIGGDALMRVASLRAAGGYRDDLIAGEEPELCVRLRASGGRVWRLDRDMTWHDAAITLLSQWWRRTMRSGYAFAEGAALHGAPPERHFAAETRRAIVWGLAAPVTILLLTLFHPWLSILAMVYPLQWWRIGRRLANDGTPIPWTYAAFLLLSRLPEAQGVVKFHLGRLLSRRSALIEYK
jgi:GT2 family glycosyltransferase